MAIGTKPAVAEILRWEDEIEDIDPLTQTIIEREADRQRRKLIMIASESICPPAVRAALASPFGHIYAEGYAPESMLEDDWPVLADVEYQLAAYRRNGDRRYYKGTDLVNFVEATAQRRIAQLFATAGTPGAEIPLAPHDIFANVQPLSGAPANNAVYSALLQPGDTLMGMNLTHGGHLTHGSPVNRSGKWYRVVDYGVDPATGRIDYEEMERRAHEHRPKLIVAGASAYPWDIDWRRLRQIADGLPERTYLMADIAHTAGLVIGGVFPNPIGYADVVTFTTHKTLCGPRAAVILSTSESIARRIDRAVFPGEQGGPHVNTIAALAVCFELAERPEFRELQRRIVANARALADGLRSRGLALAYGGTNTHLLIVDLRPVRKPSGVPVSADDVSRVLDVCGIVCNKNTIAGDLSAVHPSGLRFGTTWLTQRGFGPDEMDRVADLIHQVIDGAVTFNYYSVHGPEPHAHFDYSVIREVSRGVGELVERAADPPAPVRPPTSGWIEVIGRRARTLLQEATTADVMALRPGQATRAGFLNRDGSSIVEATVLRRPADPSQRDQLLVAVPPTATAETVEWLQALSDAYVVVDRGDVRAKADGPVAVRETAATREERQTVDALARSPVEVAPTKPFFIGQQTIPLRGQPKPSFAFVPPAGEPQRSSLYDQHVALGAQMVPFAGWLMPLRYGPIADEHRAVRETAALFDVTHMGVLEVSGTEAARFLNLVITNDVARLRSGHVQYSYLLDPAGAVMDDILVYKLAEDQFTLVVNAANASLNEAWLRAVNERRVQIDPERPDREVDVSVVIRNLKEASAGAARRVDLAIQGPNARAVLRAAAIDPHLDRQLARLKKFAFISGELGGLPVLISRTGYTGERYGYELYVHPDQAPALWRYLLEVGQPYGLRPAGLGARDSARTEAGLPLYGHELAGPEDISPIGAGYSGFVRLSKPFFVGKRALLAREAQRTRHIVRFQAAERGGRMVRPGDPVGDESGRVIGTVTSAVVVDGIRMGLAYADEAAATAGATLGVDLSGRVPSARAPEPIVVLPRFRS
ncbi:MAG: glycine cleavage system aminomethyltransferase GcvT [Chloroflexi bacterium]|nr:glycine cleavage system aminomethyltransferase GcvT [Chloroflexota bacterium]